jgi:cytidylate kinase
MKRLTIAIDGPSGVGKSTLGKAIARRLGYQYIDSGALYRAIGCLAIDSGVPLDDAVATARRTEGARHTEGAPDTDPAGPREAHAEGTGPDLHPVTTAPGTAVAGLARRADILLEGDSEHLTVKLNGVDVTERIRLPDASHAASVVATMPEVREEVVRKLREMSSAGGVVMDGRDIGTRVFPDADVKLFLDASLADRTRRRWEEERARGRNVSIEDMRLELEERDKRDRERAATPLKKAADAILIDTSDMPFDRVVQRALEIIQLRS